MHLKRVTLTGADDSVSPVELLAMSRRHPFAEWGILVSLNQQGSLRFPTHGWIRALLSAVENVTPLPHISVHLCGSYVRWLLCGDCAVLNQHAGLFKIAERMQLNFHAIPHRIDSAKFCEAMQTLPLNIIFQHDEVNDALMQTVAPNLPGRCVPLFDYSHGAGILPTSWPKPTFDSHAYGYAGGLSAGNVALALGNIAQVAPRDSQVWIDMETHIRSDSDRLFDMSKVALVLETCAPLIAA